MVLASQTVQVTSEANTRPIITTFTTMSALRNMPHGDRSRGSSALMIGEPDDATSSGASAGAAGALSVAGGAVVVGTVAGAGLAGVCAAGECAVADDGAGRTV